MHYKRWRRRGRLTLPTRLERFREKYVEDEKSGCWLWTAATSVKGYGQFHMGDGGLVHAHRAAWTLLVGPIPDGATIDHLCRKRACVNPDHLEPVSIGENVLRGDTITARNAAKTHCPQGHPYSGDNLRIRPDGARECRACRRESFREWSRSEHGRKWFHEYNKARRQEARHG
jgi:hypothetical protein